MRRFGTLLYPSFLILTLLLLITGCEQFNREASTPEPVATDVVVLQPGDTPDSNDEVITGSSFSDNTLRVWVLPDVIDADDSAEFDLFSQQVAAFDESRPGIDVDLQIKRADDIGGILSFLSTGRDVAPSILPDLILVESQHIPALVDQQLIYPIDNLLDPQLKDDLYPVAIELGSADSELYGITTILRGLTHLVYEPTVVDGTLPITWEEWLEIDEASFAFPAAGSQGVELALQLYTNSGASLRDDNGELSIEPDPLTSALTLLALGRSLDLIPLRSVSITTPLDAWALYRDGAVNMVHLNAETYLSQRVAGDDQFAPVPGTEGPLIPIVSGWTWAVSTPNAEKQALATGMIEWMMSAENLGDWSAKLLVPPARRGAFDAWDTSDPYVTFLRTELGIAQPFPRVVNQTAFDGLRAAVINVVSLTESSITAAEIVVNSLEEQ